MTQAARTPSRGPGRPPGRPRQDEKAENVRLDLIEAAIRLFSQRGFGEVGVRELAAEAGVTPAMVSYYFGDKRGLYAAMLDHATEVLVRRVGELVKHLDPDADPLAALVRVNIRTLAENPWVPQLVLREVLSGSGALREHFQERFLRRMVPMAEGLLRKAIDQGQLRSDLDPALALLSTIGMCIFPYVSHPATGEIVGFDLDEAFRDRLTEHTLQLLQKGTQP